MAGDEGRKSTLNDVLEGIAWGLFLLLLGTLWLLPNQAVPDGVWLIGAGLILVGLNVARIIYGIAVSMFTTVLGVVAAGVGIAQLYGVRAPLLAIAAILTGGWLVIRALLRHRLAASHS